MKPLNLGRMLRNKGLIIEDWVEKGKITSKNWHPINSQKKIVDNCFVHCVISPIKTKTSMNSKSTTAQFFQRMWD